MGITTLFFDSYAFFEIIKGNKNYEAYLNKVAIITTRLNLMELYYGLIIKEGREKAEKYYDYLVKFVVDFDDEIIKEAMLFRAENKPKKLSYVDCIGYMIALKNNVMFLTGDE